jgi:hypothetical protein
MNVIDIDDICVHGDLNKLIKLQKQNYILKYYNSTINTISFNGHIHVLE